MKETKRPHESSKAILGLYEELELSSKDPKGVLNRLESIALTLFSSEEGDMEAASSVSSQLEEALARTLHVLASAKTEGVTSQIMAIAPLCNKEGLVQRACAALRATSTSEDVELLRSSLEAKDVVTRRLGVAGISHLGPGSFDERFRLLATDDSSDDLRFNVTVALLNAADRNALDLLVDLLGSEDKKVRRLSHFALTKVTGREYKALPADESAAEFRNDWKEWVATNRESVELKLPHVVTGSLIGRTLLSYIQRGRVVEFDENGKQTWMLNINQPSGVFGMPNGHRLVSSMSSKRVYEYDAAGKKIWEARVSGPITRATRLADGNTLIAMQNPGKVIEYGPDGKPAWTYTSSGPVSDARRMPNGNTLVVLNNGTVMEVGKDKETVWKKGGLAQPVSAQPLENGNVLVVLAGGNRVVEMSKTRDSIWEVEGLYGAMDAQRLPSGNTLIASVGGVQEFAPDGTEVETKWYKPAAGNSAQRSVRISGFSGRLPGDPNQMVNRVHRY